MINEKIEKALNDQIREEMYSAYLYLSMSAWFESINLKGFANWMKVQNQEEQMHAMKIFDYLNERGAKVKLQKVDAYRHEQHITGCINDLVYLAIDEKDRATQIFLDWFVNEQVEEEATADNVVQQLKLVGDKGQGIFMIDRELGTRVFTPPAQSESAT